MLLLLFDNNDDFLIVDALKGRREDEEEDGDNRLTERKGALFLMLLCSENKINGLKFIDIERVIQ